MLPSKSISENLPSISRLEDEYLKGIIDNYVQYYAFGDTHTARAKRYDLEYFLEFLAEDNKELINNIRTSSWTLQATKDFVDHRLNLGESPATVSRRLATIKHLGRTLAERVPGYINPAREAKGPVINLGRPSGLTTEEITLLKEAAVPKNVKAPSFLALRNQFLLELLLATGLRADEIRLLLMSQLDDDRCWLKNVKTKGRKFRNVYLDSEIRIMLAKYLFDRESELNLRFGLYRELSIVEKNKFPLLISFYNADLAKPSSFGLSPKSIWRIIADIGKKAVMISQSSFPNLHPHKLRHTFAHGLLDSSKDIRLVAQALGHSDVRTTMRYTERTEQEVALAIEKKVNSRSK